MAAPRAYSSATTFMSPRTASASLKSIPMQVGPSSMVWSHGHTTHAAPGTAYCRQQLQPENAKTALCRCFATSGYSQAMIGRCAASPWSTITPSSSTCTPSFCCFSVYSRSTDCWLAIADPTAFDLRDGQLWHGNVAVDLVYNRQTDFYLSEPGSAALREAYLQNCAVLTPHPQAHALYADKRNLALVSDVRKLQALGAPQAEQDILLTAVPRTELVTNADADRLWSVRRHLFFKPFAGFGSRAAYRGDKLTRRAWQAILAGGYVAQELVLPGARAVASEQSLQPMKFDLRDYVYQGQVQWVAARLYQSQTTNLRTPASGFAPVYEGEAGDGSSTACITAAT